MTIDQERVLDFMGVSKGDGTRILTISDHLEWVDYERHSLSLQKKINYYLEYIYANDLAGERPGTGRVRVRIQLIMKHEPTVQAAVLLEKIESEIGRLGFEFVHRVLDRE